MGLASLTTPRDVLRRLPLNLAPVPGLPPLPALRPCRGGDCPVSSVDSDRLRGTFGPAPDAGARGTVSERMMAWTGHSPLRAAPAPAGTRTQAGIGAPEYNTRTSIRGCWHAPDGGAVRCARSGKVTSPSAWLPSRENSTPLPRRRTY